MNNQFEDESALSPVDLAKGAIKDIPYTEITQTLDAFRKFLGYTPTDFTTRVEGQKIAVSIIATVLQLDIQKPPNNTALSPTSTPFSLENLSPNKENPLQPQKYLLSSRKFPDLKLEADARFSSDGKLDTVSFSVPLPQKPSSEKT